MLWLKFCLFETKTITVIDKIKTSLAQAGGVILSQASNIGDSAKEKGFKLIEDWVSALARFEELGFEITSFAVGVSISPSLEVELLADHGQFPMEIIDEILKMDDIGTPVSLVFSTVKTTYNLHEKANCSLKEPLIVKIRVKISPEIKVFLGMPKLI